MSTRTVEQIDSWNTVPFSGGYGGLRDLADSDFSGAVVAGPTRLFMLNGKVVGVLDGSIEDFESASGTAREAPHPGLPLLAVMQERSEEVRAKYYTEDTPIADVDQTLSSGGFTGYVELSENVLSGDYYQIYHQGRSMSVAWVGNSDELITEDEAFEQANDEVGIYEVRPVDIEIIDIPEPSGGDDAGVGGVDAAADDGDDADGGGPSASGSPTETGEGAPGGRSADSDDDPEPSPAPVDTDPVAKTATDTRTATADADGAEQSTEETTATERTDRQSRERTTERDTGSGAEPDRTSDERRDSGTDRDDQGQAADASTEPREQTEDRGRQPDRGAEPAKGTAEAQNRPAERSVASEPTEQTTPDQSAAEQGPQSADASGIGPAPNDPSTSGAADLETRSIPSLDPSKTDTASSTADQAGGPAGGNAAGTGAPANGSGGAGDPAEDHPGAPGGQPARTEPAPEEHRQRPADPEPSPQQSAPEQSRAQSPEPEPQAGAGGADQSERVAELEAALEETEAERDELASELERLADERDDLQRELEEARTEVERLEQRLEEMASEDDATPDAGTRLSRGEAVDQTNLFVRYNSKGDATLESVHAGDADQSAVDDNLRLEYHTQFDADDAAVGDEPFEAFLTESIQYRFVDWLVRHLLYEIRDTGNPESMADLYDALPKIDRAELNGQVSVQYTEDGEQNRAQEQFDVVVRDRMGNPLIVANINDSRNPATDDMMTDLITRAERVGQSSESLAGAFLVTESFFEPPALETAEEATSSGLLSRDKRKSFVNLSRKGGYHLCLVEARNQEFHLAVPEL